MAIEKFAQGAGPGGGTGTKDSCKIATPMEYQEIGSKGNGREEAPNGEPLNRYKGDTGDTPFYNFDPLTGNDSGSQFQTPYMPAGAMEAVNGNPGPPSSGTGARNESKISSPFVPPFK